MFGKRNEEVLPNVSTPIWDCTNESCHIWMRQDFTFETEPSCPVCNSKMVASVKELPDLQGNS